MESFSANNRPITIPTAASPQQLQSLRQRLHAQGLIREAKTSCSTTLGKEGSMRFAEVQQHLLQSCILMNMALDHAPCTLGSHHVLHWLQAIR